ncbi:hypothetical protein C1H87_20350 [Flavivirga eckloniae]|uniref:Carboxymuconolactone decarboxylase-like domain-containing protein n=1 Tax=Flavivirga eckloniae TaxID=1803846 RepID=A0A2K9PV38_9FLAO|nr:hypothetical protein [Flavivirga eckloniae]AUP80932.1 hypothetical protein C1H87_20350 [Flavivirga eckloniae]
MAVIITKHIWQTFLGFIKPPRRRLNLFWEFQTSPLFSEAERAALNVAYKGALIPNITVEEDFDELKKHFNESEIVEIVASLALFGYLNR